MGESTKRVIFEDIGTDQAELFRRIRGGRNLEKELERRVEKVVKEMAEGISEGAAWEKADITWDVFGHNF